MKGILLAGGSGKRLYPATLGVNKHLLPLYNKPMIYYPLSILMLAGIREILLITTPQDTEAYKKIFGDGSRVGLNLSYAVQKKPRGLAEALVIGERFIGGGDVCLILGDNLFFGHGLPVLLAEATESVAKEGGAVVFGSYVPDPERYGVVEFDGKSRVLSIEEKPERPKSNWAVTGLYFYDNECARIARGIKKPSGRGELEITSVNREYLRRKKLHVKLLGRGIAWFDAGTHDSFLEASEFVATIEKRTGLLVGCIEEIAFNQGWLNARDIRRLCKRFGEQSGYGKYLMDILLRKDQDRGAK